MWNVKLKTLDYFSCVASYNLGYLGQLSPNFSNLRISVKQLTKLSESLGTRVKPNLMWNVKLKTLDYFSYVASNDLGYLGPFSPNFPNPGWSEARRNLLEKNRQDEFRTIGKTLIGTAAMD